MRDFGASFRPRSGFIGAGLDAPKSPRAPRPPVESRQIEERRCLSCNREARGGGRRAPRKLAARRTAYDTAEVEASAAVREHNT
jgi:hypothetical protein